MRGIRRRSIPAHHALVTAEQMRGANLSATHTERLRSCLARIEHFDAGFLPVGLARKILRAKRAQRRALRLSRAARHMR